MDIGGAPAQALSEFYASIFAQILQASKSASRQKFEHAIECVRNVRDAWRQVARDPEVNPAPPLRWRPHTPDTCDRDSRTMILGSIPSAAQDGTPELQSFIAIRGRRELVTFTPQQ